MNCTEFEGQQARLAPRRCSDKFDSSDASGVAAAGELPLHSERLPGDHSEDLPDGESTTALARDMPSQIRGEIREEIHGGVSDGELPSAETAIFA